MKLKRFDTKTNRSYRSCQNNMELIFQIIDVLKICPQLDRSRVNGVNVFGFSSEITQIKIQKIGEFFLQIECPGEVGSGLQAFEHLKSDR
jgi:hypothetical protein